MRAAAFTVCLVLVVAPACVGPSRTDADYREKVANSAETARSAVETARLVAGVAGRGRAPGAYTSRALSDAEGVLDSVSTQLGAVQPPTRAASALRARVLALLGDCRSVVAELRIAARRGERARLPRIARPLAGLSARLRDLEGLAAT